MVPATALHVGKQNLRCMLVDLYAARFMAML